MSRQSQDLYTSMQTAHNKIDKLDKRISKLEGGIVASADALADLEYRHLKRITALEGDGEDNAEIIQDHQLRLTALEDSGKLFKGRFERLEIAKNDHAYEIETIKENSSLQASEIMEKHNHKPIFDRLSALEEIAHEHIGYSDPPVKPAPLPRCEGCAEIPCNRPLSDFIVGHKPTCYREKHTCGECAHPCWSAGIPTNGVCFWHPLATVEIRKALGKRNYPEPVRIDDDACENFETIK